VKALVLCGGYGTRLGALTEATPKPLLPIEGHPLLGYTLALLARHGFSDVAINLHYLGDRIEAFVGTGEAHGVRVTYAREQALLGTAGTVRGLAGFFGDDDEALVVYGDLLLDEDLAAMLAHHRASSAAATLMVHRRAQSNSVLTMDPSTRITSFLERPREGQMRPQADTWVNSGVAILSRRLRQRIPERAPVDLPRDVYAPLVGEERFHGYPLHGYRCAIDSASRYAEAQAAVREGRVRRWEKGRPG
jgi:mannose-1-phosphate guanylyltransferase/phosphomannomutase